MFFFTVRRIIWRNYLRRGTVPTGVLTHVIFQQSIHLAAAWALPVPCYRPPEGVRRAGSALPLCPQGSCVYNLREDKTLLKPPDHLYSVVHHNISRHYWSPAKHCSLLLISSWWMNRGLWCLFFSPQGCTQGWGAQTLSSGAAAYSGTHMHHVPKVPFSSSCQGLWARPGAALSVFFFLFPRCFVFQAYSFFPT